MKTYKLILTAFSAPSIVSYSTRACNYREVKHNGVKTTFDMEIKASTAKKNITCRIQNKIDIVYL